MCGFLLYINVILCSVFNLRFAVFKLYSVVLYFVALCCAVFVCIAFNHITSLLLLDSGQRHQVKMYRKLPIKRPGLKQAPILK